MPKKQAMVLLDFQGQAGPHMFPITMEVFALPRAEGDVPLHTVVVEGSGVMKVPNFKGRNVATVTKFGDGTIIEATATSFRFLAGPFSSKQERGGFSMVPL